MRHDVVNPATETVIDTVELAGVAEADAAIGAARAAYDSWRRIDPADRVRLLRRFADAVDADLEHLARL